MAKNAIKIYVGCDRSQRIAFKALEHSIKRNSDAEVECRPIDNSMMPECKSPADMPYTNFSFARFGIPKFSDYQGRAIYLDADMVVLADIEELWQQDFDGAKILLLEPGDEEIKARQSKRRKQTAVMLLDCEKLQEWLPERIIGDLGVKYDRTALMSLEIFPHKDIKETIPVIWNCMDWYEKGVSKLVHYTRIETQPWVYTKHPAGELWLDEIRLMLADGSITEADIREEIRLGYVRPSLLVQLGFEKSNQSLEEIDSSAGYKMHAEMIERDIRRRNYNKKSLFRRILPGLAAKKVAHQTSF